MAERRPHCHTSQFLPAAATTPPQNQLGEEVRQLYAFDGHRYDRIVERVFARIGKQ